MLRALKFIFKEFIFSSLSVCLFLGGCALTKPCTEGGDVSWPAQVKGDKVCRKKKLSDGRTVNHGYYAQKDEDGRVIIEGAFSEGLKDGVWVQYSPEGKPLLEKHYKNGIEINPTLPIRDDAGKSP